jgi:hypothetical protein
MATPADTVESLLKLGIVVHDTVGGKKVDWATFLNSPDFNNIKTPVEGILKSISAQDIKNVIDAAGQKQAILLGSSTLADLPIDKLLQYSALARLKLQLTAHEAANTGALGSFLDWLTGSALPVLLEVAPVVLPLLL